MSDRYAQKPFLKLLESYVLDAIGHLDPATDAELTKAEPGIRKIFGASGDWRSIVVKRMQFPDGMAGAIREVWDKGSVRFVAENGQQPDPAEFARHFIDTKFPH
jgi:hypothetical protein